MIKFYGILTELSLILAGMMTILFIYLFFHYRITEIMEELNGSKEKRFVTALLGHTLFLNTRIRKGTKEYDEMSSVLKEYFAKMKEVESCNEESSSLLLGGVSFDSFHGKEKLENSTNILVENTSDLLPLTEVLSSKTEPLVEDLYVLEDMFHKKAKWNGNVDIEFEIKKSIIVVTTEERVTKGEI